MIHFWWKRVFDHPVVSNLDYYCRMDTDSLLKGRVRFDIFLVMRAFQYKYGFKVKQEDIPQVTDGLWDFAAHYQQTHPAAAQKAAQNRWSAPADHRRKEASIPTYYNNFEVRKPKSLGKAHDLFMVCAMHIASAQQCACR